MSKEIITLEQVNELKEAAQFEGTEWGDAVEPLCDMYHLAKYLSDEFYEVYCKELNSHYEYMMENTHLETTEERIIINKTKERVWND